MIKGYAKAAKEAGCPQDQFENFTRMGYVAQPKQLQFHAAARLCDLEDGPTQIGFGGARGPGKSHAEFAQLVEDCLRVDGLKMLYLRKVAKKAREQMEDLRKSVLHSVHHGYRRQEGVIEFDNDSRIIMGHFNNESDVDDYLGLEYDGAGIEEATTLSSSKYKTIRDSIRTSKDNWRPRVYLTTNPGGIGHTWFKNRFIVPAREGEEADTRFIFATVTDNVFINKEYIKSLEENTGWKLKAYRYGDWDIAAGQYFTNWNYNYHTCEPFEIPEDWIVWTSMDYGFTHYTTFYVHAADNDGNFYTIGEHYDRKVLPSTHTDGIRSLFKRIKIAENRPVVWLTGSDSFANKGSDKTIAEQYAELGVYLSRANMNRVAGATKILELLGDKDRGIEPKWKIFRNCPRLIESIPVMEHNPNKPEDVLKVDMDEDGLGGDDFYDGARYGLTYEPVRVQVMENTLY